MSNDWESEWERRRRRLFRNWFFEDTEDFFKRLEKEIEEEFKELSKNVSQDYVREKTLPDGSKIKQWGPFVYGYSITIGPDGKPEIREFGNVRPGGTFGRPRLEVKEQREPLTDVFEEKDNVKVIVELPGVEKEDIILKGSERKLTISVDTPRRKYYKEINLESRVDPSKATSSYRNGILEVTLPKKSEPAEDRHIKIE